MLATSSAQRYAQNVVQHLSELYRRNHGKEPRIAGEPAEISLLPVDSHRHRDFEAYVRILAPVRQKDVYIISCLLSPFANPMCNVDNNYVETLFLVNAARLAAADSITLVIPYLTYARQDRKDEGRVPISAKVILRGFEREGVRRIIAMDLHSRQIQGFVDIPVDDLNALPLSAQHYRSLEIYKKEREDIVVLSPDAGGAKRAVNLAGLLGIGFAVGSKVRTGPGEVSEKYFIAGELTDKHVIIVDDMIDSAGTLMQCMIEVEKQKPKSIRFAATHAVFSYPALRRLQNLGAPVVVTNSIQQKGEGYRLIVEEESGLLKAVQQEREFEWLTVLETEPMMAQAIFNTHIGDSISEWLGGLETIIKQT